MGFLLILLWGCDPTTQVVPEGGRLSLSSSSSTVYADEMVTLTACGYDPDGFSVIDGTLAWLTTDGGGFENAAGELLGTTAALKLGTAETRGCATVLLRPPSGPTQLTVRLSSGKVAEVTQAMQVKATASSLSMIATPSQLGPDGGASSITVVVTGSHGEAVEGASVFLSTPDGSLGGDAHVPTDASGQVSVTVTTTVSTTVTAEVPGEVEAVTIPLTVEEPAISLVNPGCVVIGEGTAEVGVVGSGFSEQAAVSVGQHFVTPNRQTGSLILLDLPTDVAAGSMDLLVLNPNGSSASRSAAISFQTSCP